MNVPTLPALNIAALLRQYDLRPSKRLGQNYLQDNQALRKIVTVAEIKPEDSVLEIGPGLGSLTRYLALCARQVVAVELDSKLFPALRNVLSAFTNVQLIHSDILKLTPEKLSTPPGYLVVANIPYYITSAVLRHLLEATSKPRRMVLTVQREVAERICATGGSMSLLALGVQVYGDAKIAAHIPAGAFYPPPKIDSAIVRIDLYATPLIPYSQLKDFFLLAKAGFSQKRKNLRNALAAGLLRPHEQVEILLTTAGVDAKRRAETLNLAEWQRLVESFSNLPEKSPV